MYTNQVFSIRDPIPYHVYVYRISCTCIDLTFTHHLWGGDTRGYLVAKPNLVCTLGFNMYPCFYYLITHIDLLICKINPSTQSETPPPFLPLTEVQILYVRHNRGSISIHNLVFIGEEKYCTRGENFDKIEKLTCHETSLIIMEPKEITLYWNSC